MRRSYRWTKDYFQQVVISLWPLDGSCSNAVMRFEEPPPEMSTDDALPEGPERTELTGTLMRGLAVIEALSQASQPMSLAEIAAATGLDQSTTHRLLKVLDESRYVVRILGTRRYCASPKLLHPLPLLHPLDELRREAAPLLNDLALRLRLTTVFVVFVGWERLVLDVAQAPGSLTPYYSTWLEGPLHATGGGKSLLLGLDDGPRGSLLGPGPFAGATPQALTAWPRLT